MNKIKEDKSGVITLETPLGTVKIHPSGETIDASDTVQIRGLLNSQRLDALEARIKKLEEKS